MIIKNLMEKIEISNYIEEAKKIEELYFTLLDKTTSDKTANGRYTDEKVICKINKESKPVQREILRKYEMWYEICRRFVKEHNSSKSETFNEQYPKIKKLISLSVNYKRYPHNAEKYLEDEFIHFFDTQVNILHTLVPIIVLGERNFKKIITAELLDSELNQAEILYKNDFIRASGIIAGVVLERYLITICEINEIDLNPNPTLNPIAVELYKSNKLPQFDLTLFKSIEHLATIRNKCAHPKEEPKEHEVRELLDKTKKIIFLGFLDKN